MIKPVVAAIAGVTYAEARAKANALGISADGAALYSETKHEMTTSERVQDSCGAW